MRNLLGESISDTENRCSDDKVYTIMDSGNIVFKFNS